MIAVALAPLALSGCGGGEYPSLAQRPAERASGSFAPAEPAPTATATAVPVASPDLDTTVAKLVADSRTAHAAFLAATPAAEARIASARDSAPGSEPWATATEAVSALVATRAPTVSALAALDRLAAQAVVAGAAGPPPAITAAREVVGGIAAEEQAQIGALSAQLKD